MLRRSHYLLTRALALAAFASASSACGSSGDSAPPSSATSPALTAHRATAPPSAAPSIAPPTSIVGLDGPPPVPDDVSGAGPLADGQAPPHGCVVVSAAPSPVLELASSADVVAVSGAFVVAAYTSRPGEQEVVALARIAPGGAPSLLGRIELGGSLDAARRTAPPILERLGDANIGVGLVDSAGGVRLAWFEAGAPAPSITVVEVTSAGADVRYPPAIARVDAGTLIAWTQASGTTAHVHVALVRADRTIAATHDVTPEAGSAAAPVFDAQGGLYAVDARAGISVVHRTTFGPDGAPGATSVASPLNLAAEPPSFAVVGSQLGYAAVGNGATRAVGLVTMGSSDRARAIVPGLGYGAALTIDAVPLGAGALFVAEAPSAVEPSAPHETRLRVVAAGAIGEPTIIAGMIEPRAAIASGIVAVVGRGAGVRWARCSE